MAQNLQKFLSIQTLQQFLCIQAFQSYRNPFCLTRAPALHGNAGVGTSEVPGEYKRNLLYQYETICRAAIACHEHEDCHKSTHRRVRGMHVAEEEVEKIFKKFWTIVPKMQHHTQVTHHQMNLW